MWIQFAPPAVRWLMFGCFVVLVLAVLVMPKEERARLFRGARRRRNRQPFPSTTDTLSIPPEAWKASVAGESRDMPFEDPRSLRTLGGLALAARFVIAASAVVMVILLVWMAIAFVTSVPGWR